MHYLFDFDGTLADSMPTWAGFHISMLKEFGIPCPDGFVKTITPLGNIRASEYTISLGVALTLEEYLARMQVVLSEQYGNRILLKNGVEKTLRHLISKGCERLKAGTRTKPPAHSEVATIGTPVEVSVVVLPPCVVPVGIHAEVFTKIKLHAYIGRN